ncbi:MAG: Rrf2 family transcriptional regulator [Alphaproteobacteria bacterium]
MKLTTRARYAVMAMVDIAAHDGKHPVCLADIAEREEISLPYLEQIFACLRRCGLVASVRGPGGGYRLARPAAQIRIAEVFCAMDEPLRATRCEDTWDHGCRQDRAKCRTHALWEELGCVVDLYLSSVSLADVASGRIGACGRPVRPVPIPEDVAALAVPAGKALT